MFKQVGKLSHTLRVKNNFSYKLYKNSYNLKNYFNCFGILIGILYRVIGSGKSLNPYTSILHTKSIRQPNPDIKYSFENKLFYKFVCLSGLFGLFQKSEEEKEDSELITIIKRGILSAEQDDLSTAEKILHVALRLAQAQHNEDGITYVYDILANVAFRAGDYKKAKDLFINVMQREIGINHISRDDMKIIHMSLKLAKVFEELGDDEKAEQGYVFCKEALVKHKDNFALDPERKKDVMALMITTLDWHGKFLQLKKRYEEALKNYTQAYEFALELNGEIHEVNVMLLNEVGTLMLLKGDVKGAIENMGKAIDIGKHLPNMPELAMIYINLGYIYLDLGVHDKAKLYCKAGFNNGNRHGDHEAIGFANKCMEELNSILRK